jgi:hypothetical protein
MFKEGPTLTTWSNDALRKIAGTDDLHISPLREDGVTYGTPRWIWSVAVDDALYVRAYNGKTLVGTGPRCTAGGSLPPARRRTARSSPSTGRSTTSSTMPTGRSTMAARISTR